MNDDLVSDLRLNADHHLLVVEDYRRAADRIEQLEGELNAITDDAVDRIFQLEAAIDDLLQYVSRADWHYLKPETIQALEDRDDFTT